MFSFSAVAYGGQGKTNFFSAAGEKKSPPRGQNTIFFPFPLRKSSENTQKLLKYSKKSACGELQIIRKPPFIQIRE